MNKEKEKLSKEQIEKKKKRIIKIFITILSTIVLAIGVYKLNDYIILDKNKVVNLVINNRNVTSYLKQQILIEDNNIYISKQDLKNFFDKYIYEDKKNNQIITTYKTKIAAISLSENKININGSKIETNSHAIEKDNVIYIPIKELENVYGIEIDYMEDTKVLTLDSISKKQQKAIITKDVAVKSTKRFIAKTVDRIKKGSYVIVVSEADGYAKIRTENGKIGYVKSNKLANKVTIRENMEETKQIEGKVNLVWDYYSTVASAPDRTGEKLEGVNVVSPAFLYLDSDGDLQDNIGKAGKEYINWAHLNNYKVWAMIQNAGEGMINVTSEIMNDYNKRQELIEDIVNYCVKYNLDGVNVDFENMKKEDKDMYSRFIIELTPRIKEMGLVVSVDVTAPDGADTWSMCFDRHVIGDVADYIVFMAYDEYGASSNKAGTTAGFSWVEISLKKFLETEEIDSDKIILAIPLYTRLWTVNSEGKVVKQSTVSIKDIDNVIPSGVTKTWNENLKQYYVEYKQGLNVKKMWIEDLKSLKAKLSLIKTYNLGGVASWEKGMESEGFWSFLQKEISE